LDNKVFFVGPKYGVEKEDFLKDSDLFILPSFSEGLPIAVLEAWANKIPVLMTENCNIPSDTEAQRVK
jgi:poly(glycerol-phosphate) alpha-glucosyltransferase